MPEKFLITGLPRSRTAWLSMLCTTDRTMCYHEPSAFIADIAELPKLYEEGPYLHVGISDSGLGFFVERILADLAPRTVIIDRPIKEVEASLAQLGLPATNYNELLRAALRRVKSNPLVLWVPFAALEDPRVVRQVFEHLMPGVLFDPVRAAQLSIMRVEVDQERMLHHAVANQARLSNLFRDVYPRVRIKEGVNAQSLH